MFEFTFISATDVLYLVKTLKNHGSDYDNVTQKFYNMHFQSFHQLLPYN